MNKLERKEFSKIMQRQQKANKAKQARQQEAVEKPEESAKEPVVDLAKTTRLVFFRQYNTYQALLEVHPAGDMDADAVYAKVILYIMRWFRNRLGADAYKDNPDIAFLWNDYPEPENYGRFKVDEASNINGFDFIDFETAFLKNKQSWIVYLSEPDNGQERKDIQGRVFTTEISVHKQEHSVVLGIRESCREPEKNSDDASVYRPGFVRDIFYDAELLLTEQGLDKEFAFSQTAYKLNGKSGEACRKLYDDLVVSNGRQMPILFIPDDFYANHTEEVDQKTVSLLGFCHVVVLENGCRKLFEQIMENDELVEVAEEGQLIFYRTNSLQEYPSTYFEEGPEDLLEKVKSVAQNEPLRKYCDFKGFSFRPSWWEGVKEGDESDELDEVCSQYEAEIARMQKKVNDLERDNDHLQRKIDALESENKQLDKERMKYFSEVSKAERRVEKAEAERDGAHEKMLRLNEESLRKEKITNGMISETKERYKPLINLPPLGRERKEDILKWIRDYYSDVLVVLDDAESAFYSDSRNIDWHRFCMMIHYLAGYTRYRNDGGKALDANAARDYDVEDSAYKVEPTASGHITHEMYKDEYTISVAENGETQNVIMDLHLKYGKGMDADMIRIYFYYSPVERKSFIGYMPDHLPIR